MNRLVLTTIMIFISGCSVDATLHQEIPSAVAKYLASSGLVSGSTQIGSTTGGTTTYFVQSSVGNSLSEVEQTTTNSNYKVYGSVQGSIISTTK